MILSTSIPACDANYASWGYLNEGSAFHDGTHIRMPYADVQINITRVLSIIKVTLDSEFHIVTNTTQNATLAFVYPKPGGSALVFDALDDNSGSKYTISLEQSHSMQIYANDSLVDYTTYDYQNITETGLPDNYYDEYSYIDQSIEFAVFDIELTANTTMILSTKSEVIVGAGVEHYNYQYIVGSARTFEGHTMERVHIRVRETVPFLSKGFHPTESLSLTESGTITDAIWEFNVTEFSFDIISFSAEVTTMDSPWPNWAGGVGLIAFVSVLLYLFGYKRIDIRLRKSSSFQNML